MYIIIFEKKLYDLSVRITIYNISLILIKILTNRPYIYFFIFYRNIHCYYDLYFIADDLFLCFIIV